MQENTKMQIPGKRYQTNTVRTFWCTLTTSALSYLGLGRFGTKIWEIKWDYWITNLSVSEKLVRLCIYSQHRVFPLLWWYFPVRMKTLLLLKHSQQTFLVFQDVFSVTLFVFQDVFKTSSRRVCKTSCNYVFKTSSRRLGRQKNVTLKTSSVRLHQDECLLGYYWSFYCTTRRWDVLIFSWCSCGLFIIERNLKKWILLVKSSSIKR